MLSHPNSCTEWAVWDACSRGRLQHSPRTHPRECHGNWHQATSHSGPEYHTDTTNKARNPSMQGMSHIYYMARFRAGTIMLTNRVIMDCYWWELSINIASMGLLCAWHSGVSWQIHHGTMWCWFFCYNLYTQMRFIWTISMSEMCTLYKQRRRTGSTNSSSNIRHRVCSPSVESMPNWSPSSLF